MAIGIYAGASVNSMTLLPSPTEISPTHETIWSEDTGRAQSGVNKAKMIGSVVAEKKTYAIKWAMLQNKTTHEPVSITDITSKLTKGFFYFGIGSSLQEAKTNAGRFYRSEIQYDLLQAGGDLYYKNVSVNVIEQ